MISSVSILLMAALAAPAENASLGFDGNRLWMSNAWADWLPTLDDTRKYADAARQRGLNGVGFSIHWADVEPDEGEFALEWITERLDVFVKAGLRVHLRLDCSRKVPGWLNPVYMETRTGETYVHQYGFKQISFADPRVVERVTAAMGAIARAAWTRYGERDPYPVTSIHCVFSPPLETEYVTDEWSDFSPLAQEDFRQWLKDTHGTVDEVNRLWNTLYGDWDQIRLQAAPRYDFQAYRTAALARLIDSVAGAVHETPGALLAVQFGSVWDGLSPTRGCRNVTRLARHADWVIVDDSPVFPFGFSMDYLRGMVRDKVWVNEVDGPWNPFLTNEKSVEQGIVSLRRGAWALWAANWSAEWLLDPKWTFWAPIVEELKVPRPEIRPTMAILVSLGTLYRAEGGRDVSFLVQGMYDELTGEDDVPVDFLSDEVLLRHPEWMAQYTEGIHIPASQRWMTDELVEALENVEVPVIWESPEAGSLDPYGNPRERRE